MSSPECEIATGSRPFSSRVTLGILLILVLFGISTWLAFRGSRPTWGDETFTLRMAIGTWKQFWNGILLDVHPPLYFALSKIAAYIPIGSFTVPSAVRALAYVFYILLIVLTLGLLSKKTWDHTALFLSGLLLVASAHLALFGPMMRYYALSGIGAVAATLLLLPERDEKANDGKATRKAILYAISLLIALASSYITLVILPAHLIYILKKPKQRQPFLDAFIWSIVISIPLLMLLAIQLSNQSASIHSDTLLSFIKGFVARIAFAIYSFSFGEFIRPWTPIAIPAILSLAWLVVLSWKLRKTEIGGLLWLTIGTALPLGTIALTKTGVGIEFSASRILFLAPLFLILLAMAPSAHPPRSFARRSGLIAAVVLIIVNVISTWNYQSGTNFIQSTYVIPWKQIGLDTGHEIKRHSILCYDDDTLTYWLVPETVPMSDFNLNNLSPEFNDLSQYVSYLRLMPLPVFFVAVFSPGERGPADRVKQMVGDSSTYTLQSETRYLLEDETSIRWKQMLLRRTVEPVKKVLRVYVRR